MMGTMRVGLAVSAIGAALVAGVMGILLLLLVGSLGLATGWTLLITFAGAVLAGCCAAWGLRKWLC